MRSVMLAPLGCGLCVGALLLPSYAQLQQPRDVNFFVSFHSSGSRRGGRSYTGRPTVNGTCRRAGRDKQYGVETFRIEASIGHPSIIDWGPKGTSVEIGGDQWRSRVTP